MALLSFPLCNLKSLKSKKRFKGSKKIMIFRYNSVGDHNLCRNPSASGAVWYDIANLQIDRFDTCN